jgi:hypothetical protein
MDQGVRVRFLVGERDYSLLHNIQTSFGTHPTSYTISTGAVSPGVKQQRHEADHSPPSSTEVKNSGAIPPFPTFMAWYLIKPGITLSLNLAAKICC